MPHSTYLPERMGTAEISPTGKFEAGSFQSFTLLYTAGRAQFYGLKVREVNFRRMEISTVVKPGRATVTW